MRTHVRHFSLPVPVVHTSKHNLEKANTVCVTKIITATVVPVANVYAAPDHCEMM